MAIAIALSSISFIACSDDDDKKTPEPEATAKTVKFEAQSFTEWSYFSFAKGNFVTVDQENYASDMNWDIAFLRFNIRTNGGESGKGKGAALDTKETDLSKVTSIPSTGFIADSKISVMASGGMPPKYVETTGNAALKSVKTKDGLFITLWQEHGAIIIMYSSSAQPMVNMQS